MAPDILNKIREGDHKAFELLFKEYYARLCHVSFLITKDKETTSEIVQDFFLKFWENRKNIDERITKAYFFKAISNNSIKRITRQRVFEAYPDHLTEPSTDLDPDLKIALNKSLNSLPPKCKEIFVLSRIKRLKNNDIAEKLGISPRTVEVQIRKANILLREQLKNFEILLIFLLIR